MDPWPGPRFIVCLLYYKLKRNYSTNMPQFASCELWQRTNCDLAAPSAPPSSSFLLLLILALHLSQLLPPVASCHFAAAAAAAAEINRPNAVRKIVFIYLFISEILFEVVRHRSDSGSGPDSGSGRVLGYLLATLI